MENPFGRASASTAPLAPSVTGTGLDAPFDPGLQQPEEPVEVIDDGTLGDDLFDDDLAAANPIEQDPNSAFDEDYSRAGAAFIAAHSTTVPELPLFAPAVDKDAQSPPKPSSTEAGPEISDDIVTTRFRIHPLMFL